MRNRLLEAAARVIASHGSDSVSIDTFIRAAGVARGTFYNHFKTREELLDALWSSIGHDPFLEIQSACSKLADPAERFAAVTRLVLLRAADDPTWGWLIVALSADEATLNDDLRGYPRPDLRAGEADGRFGTRASERHGSGRRDDESRSESVAARTPRSALPASALQDAPTRAGHQPHRGKPN